MRRSLFFVVVAVLSCALNDPVYCANNPSQTSTKRKDTNQTKSPTTKHIGNSLDLSLVTMMKKTPNCPLPPDMTPSDTQKMVQKESKLNKDTNDLCPFHKEKWAFLRTRPPYNPFWLYFSLKDCFVLTTISKGFHGSFAFIKYDYFDHFLSRDDKILKRPIPFNTRYYYIDNIETSKDLEKSLKTLFSIAKEKVKNFKLVSNGKIKVTLKALKAVKTDQIKPDLSVSRWIKNILLGLFGGRKSVTREEYELMLNIVPDKVKQQAKDYYNAMSQGIILSSHYNYIQHEMDESLLHTLLEKIQSSPLGKLINIKVSPTLLKLIYATKYVDLNLKFALMDLLDYAKTSLSYRCLDHHPRVCGTLSSVFDGDSYKPAIPCVVRIRGSLPPVFDEDPYGPAIPWVVTLNKPEFGEVYKEFYDIYVHQLKDFQKQKNIKLTYDQVCTILDRLEKKLKRALLSVLKN